VNVSSEELRVWHDDKGFILAPGHLSPSSFSASSSSVMHLSLLLVMGRDFHCCGSILL